MKILQLHSQHRGGGGSEDALRATVEGLRQRGTEVEVYTPNSDDLPHNRGRAMIQATLAACSVRGFAEVLNCFRPDVVHIHDLFPLISPRILPLCSRRGIPVVMTCVHYRLTCPVVTHFNEGQICTRCLGGRGYWVALNNCRHNLLESVALGLYNGTMSRPGLFAKHVSRFIAPSEFTRQWFVEQGGVDPGQIVTISPSVS